MNINLPINELLKGSQNKQELKSLLRQAELGVNSWEPIFSNFISAPLREEFFEKIKLIDDVYCLSNGGYVGAERQRISFEKKSEIRLKEKILPPIKAINIEGNFLFDRAEKNDFINSINALGASYETLGDLWLIRDRGAQLICTPDTAIQLDGKHGLVRGVEIIFENIEINQLNLPFQRQPKKFSSVEASTRLDAIASAGFGISRSKIVNHIKSGNLRLNWLPIRQSSKSVTTGDRIQLEGKGSIELLKIEKTKRERWRVEMLRK